ncbi:MAG TPA: PEGA domain-containing protein [Vicinamibacterales bacterium]|nr:PEGA domain-containing protein [Vicinamibacterales bacterium]
MPISNDRPEAPLFCDGLGERVVAVDGATGELLQILRIRPALTAVPSFEFALRERAARLANFRHAYYARVRRIDRVAVPGPGLSIVSDHVEGTRLSDILRVAYERNLQLDINTALCLIRQLVPAVALLHENAREVAHGLIAPERLIVTPHARLVIVEHVLAAAVEQLQFGRDRLWQEFRIAMPPSAGLPRFDHRADVTGVGLVALALVLGRPIEAHEFPAQLPALLNEARERTALGEQQPLSPPLRDWLARALQLDARRAFASAPEALTALEEIVADDSMYVAAPVALETFMTRYIAALLELPVDPVPAPVAQAFVPPAAVAPPVVPAMPTGSVFPPAPPAASKPAVFAPPPPAPPAPAVSSYAPPAAPMPAAAAEPFAPAKPEPVFDAYRADATATAGSKATARDISELIPATELKPKFDIPEASKPLFDPDEPFTLPVVEPAQKAKKARKGLRLPLKFSRKSLIVAALVILLAGGGVFAMRFVSPGVSGAPTSGTLVVQSNPAGVQVFVDGVDRGQTPARLSVAPGAHILELRGRGVPRVIPFTVTAGAEVSHHLEFATTPETGSLRVESQPAGAKVLVDGTDRGVAPVTVADLLPGDHEVILQTPLASARHVVNVQAGGTASLVTPVAAAATAAGPVSGWLTVKSPFSLEIREDGRLIGTSEADRLMLAAGRHDIQLVNEVMGYRATRAVTVQPGKVESIRVDLPNGVMNLNATPWAEVWVDGNRVGETPIGNLSIPIGPHEIVFRHPQFGEKRHAVSVTLNGPTRVSVDMK